MKDYQKITIVAFGDSITEAGHQALHDRWPVLLNRLLCDRFTDLDIEVINAGVGGNTSREGLRRIDTDVLQHRPDFVTVEFGNDGTWENDRRVGLEEFVANFDLIKTKISAACGGRLIVLPFTPIIDRWHSFHEMEFYQQQGGMDAFGERYRKVTRDFAHSQGLPLADIDLALRREMAVTGPESCILPDGVHLTATGNRILAETVCAVLTREIEKFLTTQPLA